MSLWDRYLAPGDLRARRSPSSSAPHPPPSPALESSPQPQETRRRRLPLNDRLRRQNNIFFTGITCSLLSILLTRRILHRKRLHDTLPPAVLPPKSTTGTTVTTIPEVAPYLGPKIHGPQDAAQAFGLATLNVFSFMLAGVGAATWWYDVGDMEDLRERVGRRKESRIGEGDGGIEGMIGEVFGEGKAKGEGETEAG